MMQIRNQTRDEWAAEAGRYAAAAEAHRRAGESLIAASLADRARAARMHVDTFPREA